MSFSTARVHSGVFWVDPCGTISLFKIEAVIYWCTVDEALGKTERDISLERRKTIRSNALAGSDGGDVETIPRVLCSPPTASSCSNFGSFLRCFITTSQGVYLQITQLTANFPSTVFHFQCSFPDLTSHKHSIVHSHVCMCVREEKVYSIEGHLSGIIITVILAHCPTPKRVTAQHRLNTRPQPTCPPCIHLQYLKYTYSYGTVKESNALQYLNTLAIQTTLQ